MGRCAAGASRSVAVDLSTPNARCLARLPVRATKIGAHRTLFNGRLAPCHPNDRRALSQRRDAVRSRRNHAVELWRC
jgi:hypothetical protein